MNKRKLGHSDLYVSELGLGCMNIGQDRSTARQTIETALELGVNYLDTADLYDQGLNEEIIGEVIKNKRKDIILATKAGNRFEKGKEGWSWDPSKSHIKQAVKDSLQRLQTDYIDLYQLHGGTIDDPIDETIEAFEELKQEGLIRYYGLSSIRPNVIREYIERSSIVSVMMQYSLLDRRPEELFPLFEQKQISVVVRGALAKGLLTDKPLAPTSSYLTYSAEELAAVRHSLDNHTRSNNSIALHYCLSSEVVASVLAGASKAGQVRDNVQAILTEHLSEAERRQLQDITKQDLYQDHR
ncbi:aldo/keto reductase [Bacillus suaedae]|uniref:Aldo/keto reductase n=1 Tax=Halalkalibacter suaedae TaxID=2822140 RepID=A0A940WT02_9BACI|nr:aldo/keto reductase [Bacillus suaedae]MBP3949638.1 aldo/keto reductase [Bacillus suaedae]